MANGAGGRPRKPTAVKKAQGTERKCRTNPNEPKPEICLPDPPDILDETGRAEWERAGKILLRLGVMSENDRAALLAYCVAVSDLYECEKILRTEGMTETVKLSNGAVRELKRQQVDIKYKALAVIKQFLTEFGMTPASRSKVAAAPAEGEGEKLARKYLVN